ncbi:hypothetical protein [Sinorhizobium mexicanum]|uniref:Uncharacterized protein n=1 Tax=Sinorhizobium mexicanum TaxID=375549 RepID=A0A859QQG5_9HYPH|nr:hypothetical protein [Sinorhizobium mexicanum]MBP1884765.1 hypothetical protein [Sinorhizobium mexicanum]QLL65645.1 hypothetical protein FKV68_30540 [Sinorhizobium mexicanum]
MSKLSKKTVRPGNVADADNHAVRVAVQRAMEYYDCDPATAAAKRGVEAWVLRREGEFTFWLHIFLSLKSNPNCFGEICQPG